VDEEKYITKRHTEIQHTDPVLYSVQGWVKITRFPYHKIDGTNNGIQIIKVHM